MGQENIVKYENQKATATSEEEKRALDDKIEASLRKVEELDARIKQLEKLNMALYKMEPELEKKLYSVENVLFDKYISRDSENYVDNNSVVMVMANLLERNVMLLVEPDRVAPDGSNIPTETSIDGIPVIIEYGQAEATSCTNNSRTEVCRPLIGGVSVSQQNLVPNSLNTISYKATKSGSVGVVIAGHTAGGPANLMVQPHNDATKRIGVVTGYCFNDADYYCDMAFIRADSGISVDNKIFLGNGLYYTITGKTADVNQQVGTFVVKSGARTGNTLGEVAGNNPARYYNSATLRCTTNDPHDAFYYGDSGSPIFYESGNNANLYGMGFQAGWSNTDCLAFVLYYPWDYIQTRIGATPP